MRFVLTFIFGACLCLAGANPALAQFPDNITAKMQAGPKFPCPPGGYYPPMYGIVGRNAGDGPAPTEAVSPCTPPEVVAAATSLGMARSHFNSPLGVKAVMTIMFTAQGTFATDGKTARPIEKLDFHVHYGLPGARLMVKVGEKLDITALNDDAAWKEISEGGAATPAMNRGREMLALTKLTPAGALWSVIEAEGHTQVSHVGGKTVLRGASPYDGMDVTVTLDANDRPESVKVVDGKTTYGATFGDYTDGFESLFLFVFPKHLAWTKNGRPFADLTVTAYKTNPYVVFPVPENVKHASAK